MLTAVRAWIWLSALVTAAGWVLSAFHQLNLVGYGVLFTLTVAGLAWQLRGCKFPSPETRQRSWHKIRRRFKRPAPFLFLTLAVLSLAAGALYVAPDGDSYGYRIPRVLHWLGQGRWHWIHTLDERMNIAGLGFEWLSAPLMLLTRNERLIFLINWVPYLLLPGLVFSLFRRLGLSGRVSWWWMWLLSAGWCYVLQAGTTHNDGYAIVYALASVDLALRAKENKRLGDLWLSLLAAALLTGVKQTNIPLPLLWFIAAFPAMRLLLRRPVASAGIVALGLLVSAVPLIAMNLRHSGTWTGLARDIAESSTPISRELHSPFWGIVGNTFCLTAQNLLPPFFPWADRWNAAMERFLQTPFGSHFTSFESFGLLSRSASDNSAGIGLGICVLVMISLAAACRRGGPGLAGGLSRLRKLGRLHWLLYLAPWLLLLIFMAKNGTHANARHLAPYYIFFFPVLLIDPVNGVLWRRRWCQWLGLLTLCVTVLMVVTSRSRPLFPIQTLITRLQAGHPESALLAKLAKTFGYKSAFVEERNLFQKSLPPGERVIGYGTISGGAEVGLWLPFISRRVERLLPDDPPAQWQAAGIHYVVLDHQWLQIQNETIDQWMARIGGNLVDQATIPEDPYAPPMHFYLVQLSR